MFCHNCCNSWIFLQYIVEHFFYFFLFFFWLHILWISDMSFFEIWCVSSRMLLWNILWSCLNWINFCLNSFDSWGSKLYSYSRTWLVRLFSRWWILHQLQSQFPRWTSNRRYFHKILKVEGFFFPLFYCEFRKYWNGGAIVLWILCGWNSDSCVKA